jgi:DNA-binding winged helix-turn-helix (wHTH) protein/predicted ATPase
MEPLMTPESDLVFPPFRLDRAQESLWRGTEQVPLRPKAFAVLHYLVAHAPHLVTQAEVLQAVWGEAYMSEGLLRGYIRELRTVLGDEAQAPRFIATVARRGWRFIAPVTSASYPASQPPSHGPPSSTPALASLAAREASERVPLPALPATTAAASAPPAALPLAPPPLLVEREAVLHQLHTRLAQAQQGTRQVVLVTGEPGMGKTAVVETFAVQAMTRVPLWLAYGQCVEHYSTGEAYLPVLEALGHLCRAPAGERLVALLRQQAPTWLVQMPWLLNAADRERLQQELRGATRERMLRECAEVIDALTAETPLLLILEDLHWSDNATLDLLALLARRRTPARLFVLGTYRPGEVSGLGHPLHTVTHALQRQGYGAELALEGLSAAAVAAYLAARCPGHRFPETLVRWLHQHTEGHPLFLVNLVEALVAQGDLVQREGRWVLQAGIEAIDMRVPESIGQMIEQQFARLSPEAQRVLEVASAVGVEFSAAAVAAGLPDTVVAVEERCAGLVRQHWLRPAGVAEWPDGTVATCYRFTHWLYQHVTYQRLGAAQQVQLHQRLGARGEVAYGGRVGEIAAELAVHFECGRDYRRAVLYRRQAAETALRRYAYPEAIAHLTRGLELLRSLPESPERSQHELEVQLALGPVLIATKGIAAPEVETAYTRALDLCRHIGETPRRFLALRGLWGFHQMQGEYQTARGLAEQMLPLARSLQDPACLLVAHDVLGHTMFWLGEFAAAREHAEQGIALYDPQPHQSLAFLYGWYDLGVDCLCWAALSLWHLGYPEQALQRSHQALTLAQELAHPYSRALALHWAMWVHQFRREGHTAQERAEAVMALSSEQGFTHRFARGMIGRGWALVVQGQGDEGIAQLRHGIAALRATAALRDTGSELARPSFLVQLAEAYGRTGQIDAGLHVLAEAFAAVHRTGERYCEAVLYRLRGEFLLRQAAPGAAPTAPAATALLAAREQGGATDGQPLRIEAETCLCRALDVARHQQAKSLELRAAMSLSRLWQQQGKRAEAYQVLASIYGWFTEGFDTADLQEAKALLEELGR